MIIKKETDRNITVLMSDSDTHARKLVYTRDIDESGKFILDHESDINFFMETPPKDGRTPAEAALTNSLSHGYVKITEEEFEKRFQKV